jgi:Thioredoxin like C-terminal domain
MAAQGRIRHHLYGEGEYAQSEMVIQQLLAEAGSTGEGTGLVSVDAHGVEAAADWGYLRLPENYTGHGRTENFAPPGGAVPGKPHVYTVPERLGRNQWALSGDWTMADEATTLNRRTGASPAVSTLATSTSSWGREHPKPRAMPPLHRRIAAW